MTPHASLGRIVIVPCDPEFNNGADHAPAIITRCWSEDYVNVRVVRDAPSDSPYPYDYMCSVNLLPERPGRIIFNSRDELPDGIPYVYTSSGKIMLYVGWWPPRIEGNPKP